MVGVSASVNLQLPHKVQKFSSDTSSPGWSRKKGRKMVAVVVVENDKTSHGIEEKNFYKVHSTNVLEWSFSLSPSPQASSPSDAKNTTQFTSDVVSPASPSQSNMDFSSVLVKYVVGLEYQITDGRLRLVSAHCLAGRGLCPPGRFWRVRGKIIRSVLCSIVCNNCAQCNAHTYEQT